MLPHTAKLSASFVDLHADGRRWSGIFKMSDRQPDGPRGIPRARVRCRRLTSPSGSTTRRGPRARPGVD